MSWLCNRPFDQPTGRLVVWSSSLTCSTVQACRGRARDLSASEAKALGPRLPFPAFLAHIPRDSLSRSSKTVTSRPA